MSVNIIFLISIILIGIMVYAIKNYIKEYSKEYSSDHYITRYTGTYIKGYIYSFKKYYRIKSNFTIKLVNENMITRFLKKTGLIKEFQTQNTSFDDIFFVLSDNTLTCNNLSKNKILLEELNKLNETLKNIGWKLKNIKNSNGHLSIHAKPNKWRTSGDEEYEKYLESIIDKHLYKIKDILQNPSMISEPDKFDSVYKRIKKYSKILSAISIILFIYIISIGTNTEYYYMELAPLIKASIIISIVSLSSYLFFIINKFKHTSKFYELLILPSISILFSTLFCSYLVIYFGNIMLDKSKSREQASIILKKIYKKQSSRKPAKYTFIIKDKNHNKDISIHTSKEKYKDASLYDVLHLNIKQGYFGFEWVDSSIVGKRN